MSANDANRCRRIYSAASIFCLFLATFVCGCTSRIVKPESQQSFPRQSVQGQGQLEITYSVYPGSLQTKQELANVFRETCASHGINAREAEESSGPSQAHVALYELEGQNINMYSILLGLATLFLAPVCEEIEYPIELHVLQSRDGDTRRPRVFRYQYVIDECIWVPTLVKDSREHQQLRGTALRLVLDKAVESTLLGR